MPPGVPEVTEAPGSLDALLKQAERNRGGENGNDDPSAVGDIFNCLATLLGQRTDLPIIYELLPMIKVKSLRNATEKAPILSLDVALHQMVPLSARHV